ncbi:unnamed protein product [Hanseniaspora opuntiae]
MSADPLYITPHEAALAVIATSMKKARLTLQTLMINSFMGGVLFSSGGMLYSIAVGNNPEILEQNPGMLNFLGGSVFGIGLFYVIINGCDLFNSNILFFTVGLLRNAVNVYDLLISWVVSWVGNLAGSLFMSYVICHLSGSMTAEHLKQGTRNIAESKMSFSFIQVFLKGVGGNFFVCLAVYFQLMSKPIHVKFFTITLPIFTFVTTGFTHTVADMFLVPTGMFNGANISVGLFIWKNLIPASLGNIVGDSRVVRVKRRNVLQKIKNAKRRQRRNARYSETGSISSSVTSGSNINPPGVFPIEGLIPLTKEKSIMNGEKEDYEEKNINNEDDNSDNTSSLEMGTESEGEEYDDVQPYSPELPVINNTYNDQNESNADLLSSMDSLDLENQQITANKNIIKKKLKDKLKEKEKDEFEEFDKTGRYNPERNKLGTKLSRILTTFNDDLTKGPKPHSLETLKKTLSAKSMKNNSKETLNPAIKLNTNFQSIAKPESNQSSASKDLVQSRRSSLASSRHSLSSKAEIRRQFKNQNMTNTALKMADPVAGSVDLDESFVQRPSRLRHKYSYQRQHTPTYMMRNYGYDNDNSEEQSIGD